MISPFRNKLGFLATLALALPSLATADSSPGVTSFAPRRQHAVRPTTTAGVKTLSPLVVKADDYDESSSSSSSRSIDSPTSLVPRGGKLDAPSGKEIQGVVVFVLLEMAIRKFFQQQGIKFPAQLAGCVFLFTFLILAQIVKPGLGDAIFDRLSPGAGLLAKWMGVFFVPGLCMLPLAPPIGNAVEVVKALGVVVGGFFYSLLLVTYSVYGVRKLLGTTSEVVSQTISSSSPPKTEAPTSTAKPYSAETLGFLVKGTVLSAAVSIAATKTNQSLKKPLETIFLTFATLASYVWGSRLPPNITFILNPLLSSALVTLAIIRLFGMATGATFVEVLKSYTCKKLHPLEIGGGDLLLFLLSPSVISFAIGMYRGKKLIAANLPAILTGVSVGSTGSLFGTAALCRLIQLGGPEGSIIRLAAVPRSVQTALGMTIASLLGGDVAIAATLIILTGIFGGMVGVKTLDAWGMKDSVSRGMGIGSAGLSLGVVSIKGEPEAFAFAGLCLVLTAVAATCLASIPAIADMLIQIAGGAAPMVVPSR